MIKYINGVKHMTENDVNDGNYIVNVINPAEKEEKYNEMQQRDEYRIWLSVAHPEIEVTYPDEYIIDVNDD